MNVLLILTICLIITILIEYIPIVIFLNISKKYFVCVNVLTNVIANVILIIIDILNIKIDNIINRTQLVVLFETIIVMVEIFLYCLYFNKYFKNNNENMGNGLINIKAANILRIILLTIIANLLSVIIGRKILEFLL